MPQKTKAVAKAKAPSKKSSVKKSAAPAPVMAKPAKASAVAVAKPAKSAKSAALPPATAEITKAKAALKVAKGTLAANPEAPARKAEKAAKSRKISVMASANEAASALSQKWATLFKKSEQIEAKPYNMKAVFEEKTAIVHKVLGWGYILANRNDRLEVLFKDGIKYLISNYKP